MRRADRELIIENSEIYRFYLERLTNIALSQFEWKGMPDTCNRRYFEERLFYNGTAAFIRPEMTDFWLSLGYVQQSFDVYGDPTRIIGYGYNQVRVIPGDFMVLYDNNTKCSIHPRIKLFAKLLWEIHQVFRSNLQHQVTPFIVATSRSQELTVKNLFNRILGFQPVIPVKDTENIDEAIKTLPLNVDFKGKEMIECLNEVWKMALSMLGVTSQTTKKERLLDGELTMNRQSDIITLNSRLLNRIEFCNKMNKKYGLDLSVNLSSQAYDFEPYGQHELDHEPDEEYEDEEE